MMSKHVIFYFSGTGNSRQVAEDIAKYSKDSPEIVNIATWGESSIVESEKVGIIFPVYFWGLPNIVSSFVKGVKLQGVKYVYAVATYGGFVGRAIKQIHLELKEREIFLCAGFKIQMPGNYIVMYGARSEQKQKQLFEKEELYVKRIANAVNQQAEILKLVEVNPFIDCFSRRMHKGFDRVSEKAQDFQVNEACVKCGLCKKICPVQNIVLKEGVPVWGEKCEFCMGCIQHCPKEAIQYKKATIGRKHYVNPNVYLQ